MKGNRRSRLGEHADCEAHALKHICKVMHPVNADLPVVLRGHSIDECVSRR